MMSNYQRFKGLISDTYNSAMYYFAMGSIVSGPLIAYFDRYSDVHTHSLVAAIFVICEIFYL